MANTPVRLRPADLDDPQTANEALAHWDELDPRTLAALAADPHHAPRLALLQASERWLARQLSAHAHEIDACPASDELYDFGRGPGSNPLAASRRASIDRHLAACAECELSVETLASPPPVPLDLSPLDEGARVRVHGRHADEARPVPAIAPAPRTLAPAARRGSWIPFAVAASALVAFSVWRLGRDPEGARFPEATLLRGEAGGALHHPRERVLARTSAIASLFPALARGLAFEIEPVAEAQSYRVEIYRHAGGAFDAGVRVLERTSAVPGFEIATSELGAGQATLAPEHATFAPEHATLTSGHATLAPGHYTWKAWVLVRGLEQPLGGRDFEVVASAEIAAELGTLAALPADERNHAALELLEARGFPGDARVLARELPPSPERDLYLERAPGR